jgi:uncharacterized protein DUF4267
VQLTRDVQRCEFEGVRAHRSRNAGGPILTRVLVGGFALALAAIGVTAVVAPRMSSEQFGIPTADPDALMYVRTTGARDVLLAAILVRVIDRPAVARRVLGSVSVLGLIDATILTARHGLRPQLALHLGGFVAMALSALIIERDG